ncbi:hypothetical protein [Enterovirga rhinocerotis]|uniref:FecR family protein n=1 Tax=Enterovirga rhinocerotis TaxID=1339210 RepID=A0A4R7BPK0_9HYPH|nr:hypothetical protein [Enterovirga rhinocerotis]TDR87073.1 hypothetical protein EV668_4152 [Enterovirga rhinocerotis]
MTRRAATLGVIAVALAVPAGSMAAKAAAPETSFPARAGKSRLAFECAADKAIWLRVTNPPRGWLADRASVIRIGRTTFRVEIDGASDSFILSDVPLPKMGVTDGLLAAAKAGEELVLAGRAAEQIPGPDRSFPLTGARAKIERLEKACGRRLVRRSGAALSPS